MADTRNCDHCGTLYTPRREHARFCSARCRVAWNRGKLGYPPAEVSALRWSVSAMSDVADRIARAKVWEPHRAIALIGEAVWWVTIVDATMVRHHPEEYDEVLASLTPGDRTLIEETLAGLRSVRNRAGHDIDMWDLVEPAAPAPESGRSRISAWTWKPMSAPEVAALPPRGQAWELSRYESYQSHLAGHTIGGTFGRVSAFLREVTARAFAAEEPTGLAAI